MISLTGTVNSPVIAVYVLIISIRRPARKVLYVLHDKPPRVSTSASHNSSTPISSP